MQFALAAALAGCGGAGAARPGHESSAEPRGELDAPSPGSTTPVPPTTPSAEPPELSLQASAEGASVRWALQNRSRDRVRVAGRVRVEREQGGAFAPVDAQLSLRDDCEHPAPACRELVPGAELQPPAWPGTTGDSQCGCEGCAPAAPGRYRLVVEGCRGEYRLDGAPFALGAQ
jgi:hypothetical protein